MALRWLRPRALRLFSGTRSPGAARQRAALRPQAFEPIAPFPAVVRLVLTEMLKSKSKGGFYAVRVGRQTGVYTTWEECQKMVHGFKGAAYKKFSNSYDAWAFVDGRPIATAAGPSKRKRSADEADLSVHAPTTSTSRQAVTYPPLQAANGSASTRINVYCDGASSANGRANARAGWGVWFEDPRYHYLNEARRLPGPTQTNNRAELTAVWRACLLCPDPSAQLVIYTDSKYTVQAINDWQKGWRQRGWKLASGGPVLNVDLIRRIERAFRARPVRPILMHVAGHAGVRGNEEADRLAVQGANMAPAHPSEELNELSDSDDGLTSNKRARR